MPKRLPLEEERPVYPRRSKPSSFSPVPGLHGDGVYETLSSHQPLKDSMARITGIGGVFLRSK
ncbi:MAG: hypothetical protein WA789_05770, partial [Candidatus Acidiferrum sp.]